MKYTNKRNENYINKPFIDVNGNLINASLLLINNRSLIKNKLEYNYPPDPIYLLEMMKSEK